MQPLNPFLGAFSKSSILAQCSPTRQHILLVPSAEILSSLRDVETGAPLTAPIASEDFLASHVLRIPLPKSTVGVKDGANLRDVRGKAKIYGTVNGRSIVIKDSTVYTNKGFRSLAQANLLTDFIWYPDTLDATSFLVYYISRPLVGTWDDIKILPAVLGPGSSRATASLQNGSAPAETPISAMLPRKKDIRTFYELLNHFPAIARQMQSGLEKLFRDFAVVLERPLPPLPSANNIPDPEPEGPIASAVKRARSSSVGCASTWRANDTIPVDVFLAEDDEDILRTSLESAVTSAIDLFQEVDKQQLSLLGATTELTGPVVERLIERYVTENVHHLLFPRLSALKRPEDLQLEAKIRLMDFIDVSQLGIVIDGGSRGKRHLILRLGHAVEEFRKMTIASSPQDMLESLLSTMRAATDLADEPEPKDGPRTHGEKPIAAVNADTLVSLLLFVVIRAQMKHLHARLAYIRHFIFIDDVDSGETGYALSTFEAVLTYLDRDSGGLRKASRRNKALWDAVSTGNMPELRRIVGTESRAEERQDCTHRSGTCSRRASTSSGSCANPSPRPRSTCASAFFETFSRGSGLSHVFPFQVGDEDGKTSPVPQIKRIKRVTMDARSLSSGSEVSFRSRAASICTFSSGMEGDTSFERLARTQDSSGESVLMMAVQHGQSQVLKYLLSLKQYYDSPDVILDDVNNEGTTLLSAAIQQGDKEVIGSILDLLFESSEDSEMREYVALQDTWGRSAAHYLFHAPHLITSIGLLLPWRQKDRNGQTPLFALFRSYDHGSYQMMVDQALQVATRAQGDGQPLHLDEHVDIKGNTLLHIVNEAQLALRILQTCDVDVNATNEKKFTPLMVASKYGRFDMFRVLFSDPRVDVTAKELRGLTAVELAKDDEVRNKIDDLVLFSLRPGPDARTTGVVRSYLVEDASIRFVVKSGAPVDAHSYTVTTCRRSLADFEHLVKLLEMENPASWMPSLANIRSPTQILSKPSRAVLKELQIRMDWFLRVLLSHPTFATHEMLWEFFLVPDLQLDMMEQRSVLKATTRVEKVLDELEPIDELREVEQFVDHAREVVRTVHFSTRSVARRTNVVINAAFDLHESSQILSKVLGTIAFLPPSYASAFDMYVRCLAPPQSFPLSTFFSTFLALHGNVEAILKALARPPQLISRITSMRRDVERNYNSLSRSSRWPLGLLDDTRQRLNEEREGKVRRGETEVDNLGKELRYTQQTVAAELAGWREMHEKMTRGAIRDLAKGMLVAEKTRMEAMQRALRKVREASGSAARQPARDARNEYEHDITLALPRDGEVDLQALDTGAPPSVDSISTGRS